MARSSCVNPPAGKSGCPVDIESTKTGAPQSASCQRAPAEADRIDRQRCHRPELASGRRVRRAGRQPHVGTGEGRQCLEIAGRERLAGGADGVVALARGGLRQCRGRLNGPLAALQAGDRERAVAGPHIEERQHLLAGHEHGLTGDHQRLVGGRAAEQLQLDRGGERGEAPGPRHCEPHMRVERAHGGITMRRDRHHHPAHRGGAGAGQGGVGGRTRDGAHRRRTGRQTENRGRQGRQGAQTPRSDGAHAGSIGGGAPDFTSSTAAAYSSSCRWRRFSWRRGPPDVRRHGSPARRPGRRPCARCADIVRARPRRLARQPRHGRPVAGDAGALPHRRAPGPARPRHPDHRRHRRRQGDARRRRASARPVPRRGTDHTARRRRSPRASTACGRRRAGRVRR